MLLLNTPLAVSLIGILSAVSGYYELLLAYIFMILMSLTVVGSLIQLSLRGLHEDIS